MKKVECPECGTQMRDETIGWRCPKCKGFVDMNGGKFYEHREKPFMPPQTNADRIRTMAEPELAATLISADYCTVCDHYKDGLCDVMGVTDEPINNYCMEACLKWLLQPVEEG